MTVKLLTEDRVREIFREELQRAARPASDWMRLGDAARHLGYSEKTLRRRVKEGLIETSKDGRMQFVRLSDLEKLREQKKETARTVSTRG
jgi:DNA-binding transcriptional regulator PaaX